MIIRKEKKQNEFTIMSTDFIKDKNLSLKAKGLMATILQFPDDWKLYLSDLKNRSKDGRDSTNSAIKELENAGYIKRNKQKKEFMQFAGYEYIVYESKTLNPEFSFANGIAEADNPTRETRRYTKFKNTKFKNLDRAEDSTKKSPASKPITKQKNLQADKISYSLSDKIKNQLLNLGISRRQILKFEKNKTSETIITEKINQLQWCLKYKPEIIKNKIAFLYNSILEPDNWIIDDYYLHKERIKKQEAKYTSYKKNKEKEEFDKKIYISLEKQAKEIYNKLSEYEKAIEKDKIAKTLPEFLRVPDYIENQIIVRVIEKLKNKNQFNLAVTG